MGGTVHRVSSAIHATRRSELGTRIGIAWAVLCVGLACGGSTDWQSALDDVIEVERAFAAHATDTTVHAAFTEYLAPDAILFQPGPVPAGEALRERPLPADLRLEWTPAWADASAAGDLGYTTGPWSSGRRADSSFQGGFGWYATIWQRQPDGDWRAILDFGTTGPFTEPPADVETPSTPPGPAESADSAARIASLRLVDEDLHHAFRDTDSTAFHAFLSSETRFLRDASPILVGPDNAGIAFATVERSARWTINGAATAKNGDLGYTYGTWSMPSDSTPRSGSWVRIWRRRPDGDWTLALDVATGTR